jgi:hypothetical protein
MSGHFQSGRLYGASIRAAVEQAAEARKAADRLACEAWNKRMLGFQGPAQPSPALGDTVVGQASLHGSLKQNTHVGGVGVDLVPALER